MAQRDVRGLLRRRVTPALYQQIREEWKRHSMAEDQRDIEGLLATLSEECVYEIVTTGHVWRGKEGARSFYQQLLGAFPDIHFDLTDIVIGPQGVCEEALATGTHEQDWLDFPASGRRVSFRVVIFFPWDPERGKFAGEKIYFEATELSPPG